MLLLGLGQSVAIGFGTVCCYWVWDSVLLLGLGQCVASGFDLFLKLRTYCNSVKNACIVLKGRKNESLFSCHFI